MTPASYLEHDWFPKALPRNVVLGEGSYLVSAYTLLHYEAKGSGALRVGRHSGVYHGTFFELGPNATVEIGDYTTIVGAIISSDDHVSIGSHVFVAHEVVIADQFDAVPPGAGYPSALPADRNRSVVIEDGAWIGARVVLLGGAHVGEGAVVGIGTVLDGTVPPRTVVAGSPPRIVKEL